MLLFVECGSFQLQAFNDVDGKSEWNEVSGASDPICPSGGG